MTDKRKMGNATQGEASLGKTLAGAFFGAALGTAVAWTGSMIGAPILADECAPLKGQEQLDCLQPYAKATLLAMAGMGVFGAGAGVATARRRSKNKGASPAP